MMKFKTQNLADVFGWMNVKARDFADSLGNLMASRENIAKASAAAQNAGEKSRSVRGTFEIAANAIRWMGSSGSSGRPFKSTFGMQPPRPLAFGS